MGKTYKLERLEQDAWIEIPFKGSFNEWEMTTNDSIIAGI